MFVDKFGVEFGRVEDKIIVEVLIVNFDIDGVVSIEEMLEVFELIILVVCGIEFFILVDMEDIFVIKGEEDLFMIELDNIGGRLFVLSVFIIDVIGVFIMFVFVSNLFNEEEYIDIFDIGVVVVDIVSIGEDIVDIFKFRDVDEFLLFIIEDMIIEVINKLFVVEFGMFVVINCFI